MKPKKQSKQSKGLGTPELSWDMAIDWGDLPELNWEPLSLDWELPELGWDVEPEPWGDLPDTWEETGGQDGKNSEE